MVSSEAAVLEGGVRHGVGVRLHDGAQVLLQVKVSNGRAEGLDFALDLPGGCTENLPSLFTL